MLPVHVSGLVVQSKEGHWRVDSLSALGTQPHHLQACLVDLFCELIHGNVTWSAYQHWSGGGKSNIAVIRFFAIPKYLTLHTDQAIHV